LTIIQATFMFLQEVFARPAILVGIVALIGLLIQKKPFTDVLKGTIKTILGFVILSSGAGIVGLSLKIFNDLLIGSFNITGILPLNEVMMAVSTEKYGTQMAIILAIAMVLNILLARITKFKFIYLSGHEAMWISCLMAIVLNNLNLPAWQVIVGGSMLTGLYMTMGPLLTYKMVCNLTGTKDIALAHTGGLAYFISAKVAKYTGNKEKSAEDVNVPKHLNFLRDTSISITLAMFFLYLGVCILSMIVNPAVAAKALGANNFIIVSVMNSVQFAAGVYVIMAGVRMALGEIIPAFTGIANKLVPNAVPALDIPVLFPYAPNSVMVGFMAAIFGILAGFAMQILLIGTPLELPIVLPTVFGAFFIGATSGALSNKEGGIRGVVIGGFVSGILRIIFPALLIAFGKVTVSNTTFAGADASAIGIFFGSVSKIFSGQGVFILILVMFALPIAYSLLTTKKLESFEK